MNRPRRALTATAEDAHTARTPRLLLGWAEIARYARKQPHTLQHYRLKMAFPVIRWGRHVVSSPTLIDDWLLTIEQQRRRRRMALASQPPPKA
ncbi:MAG TPA: hypothetical protein VNC82_15640 [Candidatus Limnocylindria bacterium]|nr:hypothetical protein [Candidatus Limnocylindria bacterium]